MSDLKSQCIALARDGGRPLEIALQTGLQPNTVHHYLCDARKSDGSIPSFRSYKRPLKGVIITISRTVVFRLREAGDRRGCSAERIAERLINAIVKDNLVDAILDDGVSTDD